jgi:hypothetical protein
MGQNMSQEWVRKWVSQKQDFEDGADDPASENRGVKCTKGVFRRGPVSVGKWVRSIFRTDSERFLRAVGFDGQGGEKCGKSTFSSVLAGEIPVRICAAKQGKGIFAGR